MPAFRCVMPELNGRSVGLRASRHAVDATAYLAGGFVGEKL